MTKYVSRMPTFLFPLLLAVTNAVQIQRENMPDASPAVAGSGCKACQAGGNTYRALPGCRSFTEESTTIAPRKLDCPAGLIFDTTLCVCNYENAVACASDCNSATPSPTQPPDVVRPPSSTAEVPPIIPKADDPKDKAPDVVRPPSSTAEVPPIIPKAEDPKDKVPSECGTCGGGGVIFRPVPGTGCASFTKEAATRPAVRFECNVGLAFDVSICGCNFKEAAGCGCIGDGKP